MNELGQPAAAAPVAAPAPAPAQPAFAPSPSAPGQPLLSAGLPGFQAAPGAGGGPAGPAQGQPAPVPAAGPSPLEQQVMGLQQQLAQLAAQTRQAPRPAAPAAAPAQSPQTNILGVPQFDPQNFQYLTRNEQGEVVPTLNAPPGVADQYHAYQAAMAQAIRKIATDPEGALAPVFEKMLKPITEQRQREQVNQIQDQITAEISPWAVELDANGQMVQVFNYQTGQMDLKLTPRGEAYAAALKRAEQFGIAHPMARHEFALAKVPPAAPAQPQQRSIFASPAQPTLAQHLGVTPGAAPMMSAPGFAPPPRVAGPGLNAFPNQPAPAVGPNRGPRKSLYQMMQENLVASGHQL